MRRGCGWNNEANVCRMANRYSVIGYRDDFLGFRVVRMLPNRDAGTRRHGDAVMGADQSLPVSPRRFSSPCHLLNRVARLG